MQNYNIVRKINCILDNYLCIILRMSAFCRNLKIRKEGLLSRMKSR